jgi:hypothetical protein
VLFRGAVRLRLVRGENSGPRAAEQDVRDVLRQRCPGVAEQGRFVLGGRVPAPMLSRRERLAPRPLDLARRFVVASVLATPDEVQQLQDCADDDFAFVSDPTIHPADVWTHDAPGGGLFGDLRQALHLVGATPTQDRSIGQGVNVVILDYGISRNWLRRASGQQELHGWSRYPCSFLFGDCSNKGEVRPGDEPPPGLDHGHMIARLILAIAPGVRIWDAPLLPDTVLGPPGVTTAESMFERIQRDIVNRHKRVTEHPRDDYPIPRGPWILVNAWGVLDPFRYDPHPDDPAKAYWNNPENNLVEIMGSLSDAQIDVVFAAGNCGTPGAHPLCAETATGPGTSIIGANAHPAVLTVGAVRVDGLPIGSSAQGPGALAERWPDDRSRSAQGERVRAYQKPDLCAPSQFRGDEDAAVLNTGTSAACGIAAGLLAALRGDEVRSGLWSNGWPSEENRRPRTPTELRAILRSTARRAERQGWDPRLGWGIADLAAARRALDSFL